MNNFEKKGALIGAGVYILANLLLNNIFHREFANITVFFITSVFFFSEVFFWLMLFTEIKDDIKKWDMQEIFFTVLFFGSMIGTGLIRIVLLSSPYMNDLILSSMLWRNLAGFFHLLLVFAAVMFMYLAFGLKDRVLIIISVLNLVAGVIIWVEFDTVINVIIRIIIGISSILYIIIKGKNKKI